MSINPLAKALNDELNNSVVAELLSARGKSIYFPSKGILGQAAEAGGKNINATIGTAFEEDGTPLCLEVLEEMVQVPDTAFLYAPSGGNPNLRAQWQKMLLQKNPSLEGKNISNPVVSLALTHALSVAGYLFVDEGDEILLPDLYWDNYDLVFNEGCGAVTKTYNTFVNGGFDIEAFSTALNEGPIGKKIVLLNFPNNPTGYTVTNDEVIQIEEVLKKSAESGNKILVLCDDAYFGLVYKEGIFEESIFAKLADLHENILAVKLDGPTKEDYVWGLRVGFMTYAFKGATDSALAAIASKTAGVVRGNISNAPNISQQLLLKAYQSEKYSTQKQEKYEILKSRYEKICTILEANPEYKQSFEAMPFNSGYFMCVKLNNVDPEAVRKELLENYDTGVIVLAGLVRLAFSAVPLAKLEQLFVNLDKAVKAVASK